MKIGYSKTFPIIGKEQWEKIWIEDEVTGTEEDARSALYKLKKQVENFHYESNKAAEKERDIEKAEDALHKAKSLSIEPIGTVEGVVSLINKCKTIEKPFGLKAYELLAKNNPQLQDAYNEKLKELQP